MTEIRTLSDWMTATREMDRKRGKVAPDRDLLERQRDARAREVSNLSFARVRVTSR